jgi:hypothetical protein
VSERVYEPDKPDKFRSGWTWWPAVERPAEPTSYLPKDVFAALAGGVAEHYGCIAYPTREAALAALDAARAKVGGAGDRVTVPGMPDTSAAAELAAVLEGYARWEADMILDDEAWRGREFPAMTEPLWDRLLELQGKRNVALSRYRGGAS